MHLDIIEKTQVHHQDMTAIRLKMKNEEKRSRRNNIKVHGISEAVAGLDLYATVTATK